MRSRLLLAAFLLLSPAARAEEIELGARAVALDGQMPTLTVKTRRNARDAVIKLKRSDGKDITLPLGALKGGKARTVPLEQPQGKFHYEGQLEVFFPADDAPVVVPISLDAIVGSPPAIKVDAADLALEQNRFMATMNMPARMVRFTITGDDGKVIDRGETTFKDVPAGEKLAITFKNPRKTKVLKMELVGQDTNEVFTPTLVLVPWSLDIPHEDVLFESGKADVLPAEHPKVVAAVEPITDAARKFGNVVDVSLYVAGHTDTVGNVSYNQELSQKRARSIAVALRKAGVRCPIFYGGYGEWRPATKTPDETDEPTNRRAVYTLSAAEPHPAPPGGWHAL